ncbi:MAG: isoamylase early set domain-containing protein [Candidatus Eisenbacteria bacterium]
MSIRPGTGRALGLAVRAGPVGGNVIALVAFGCSLWLGAAASATEVTFLFSIPGGATSVSVAGSFNGWNTGADPLADADGDGVWEVVLDLASGAHQYKFVVNATQWVTDETAFEFADDGFGGKNSVLQVGTAAMVVGPAAGKAGVAGAGRETPVRFRFRCAADCNEVTVAGTFNEWNPAATRLSDADGDSIWETTLRLSPGTYQYKFVIGGTQWHADEHASKFTDDGYGGKNSVLEVGPEPQIAGEPDGAGVDSGTEVVFRFGPTGSASAVSVAGTFNEWNAAAHPMKDEDGDGVWETSVRLAPGAYAYQFVVDGDEWVSDPFASAYEEDGFGGRNALATVGAEALILGVR